MGFDVLHLTLLSSKHPSRWLSDHRTALQVNRTQHEASSIQLWCTGLRRQQWSRRRSVFFHARVAHKVVTATRASWQTEFDAAILSKCLFSTPYLGHELCQGVSTSRLGKSPPPYYLHPHPPFLPCCS
jgi:hypothetical protein